MAGASVTFRSRVPLATRQIDAIILGRLQTACRMLEREVKASFSGPKHGRRYIKPGLTPIAEREAALSERRGRPVKLSRAQRQKRYYIASAPGETPAVVTGLLRASIRSRVWRTWAGYRGEVGSNLHYAPYLEFGTSKMRPRPYLRPAYERLRGQIRNVLARGSP